MASLKWGVRDDGARIGPVAPARVQGSVTWYDTEAEMLAAGLPLEPARREKLAALDRKMAAVLAGGFVHGGRTWTVDRSARENVGMALLPSLLGGTLPNGSGTITLIDADGGPASLTLAELQAMASAGVDFYFGTLARRHALAAEIAAAADTAALAAIDIDAGWPG